MEGRAGSPTHPALAKGGTLAHAKAMPARCEGHQRKIQGLSPMWQKDDSHASSGVTEDIGIIRDCLPSGDPEAES